MFSQVAEPPPGDREKNFKDSVSTMGKNFKKKKNPTFCPELNFVEDKFGPPETTRARK